MAVGPVCGDSRAMSEPHVPVKVFLVDDSSLIRDRVAEMLACEAMDIVGQSGVPQAAVDGILASLPDVVVLDVQLEGGSGLQVLRAVHLVQPDIPFVVFSNNAGPAYRKRYLSEGAARFLDKSSEFNLLAQAVAQTARHIAP